MKINNNKNITYDSVCAIVNSHDYACEHENYTLLCVSDNKLRRLSCEHAKYS